MTMIIATTRPVVTKTATMRIKQVYVLAQVNNNAVKVVMQCFVHGWASPFLPLGQSGLAQVRVHAVPIEMDGVVGESLQDSMAPPRPRTTATMTLVAL
jgi:hypothetical protein